MMQTMDRRELRKMILARRDRLPVRQQEEKSRVILSRLLGLEEIRTAGHLFVYVSFRSEVRTLELIAHCLQEDKKISVPLTQVNSSSLLAVEISDPESQLAPGYCGIPEPVSSQVERHRVDPAEIDVVIVPGSVFDHTGGRLGYGGGYYDRFLSGRTPQALRIALAYELQVVERVPVEAHDQGMDLIVTEETVYRMQ
ncbi:5-formyltetrahydrofolate cyclo-ligase [Thermodesulfobacteriota bacterium B35]